MASDSKDKVLEELIRDSLHLLDTLEVPRVTSDNGEKQAKPRHKGETPDDTRKASAQKSESTRNRKEAREVLPDDEEGQGLFDRLSDLTSSALKLARRTTDTSLKVGKALIKSQDQLKLMVAAGESLRDLREVAGLTISDVSEALNLKDKTLLEAVENGTATLSFELILRLSALLARNDPIPFILKYTRTYSPETWRVLSDWGVGRIPLQFERERQFVNIFRRHDAARKLSDDGFKHVLEFTRAAFEMSLHFIAEQEGRVSGKPVTEPRERDKDADMPAP